MLAPVSPVLQTERRKRWITGPMSAYGIKDEFGPGGTTIAAPGVVPLYAKIKPSAYPGEYERQRVLLWVESDEGYLEKLTDYTTRVWFSMPRVTTSDFEVEVDNTPVVFAQVQGNLKVEVVIEAYSPTFAWNNLPNHIATGGVTTIQVDDWTPYNRPEINPVVIANDGVRGISGSTIPTTGQKRWYGIMITPTISYVVDGGSFNELTVTFGDVNLYGPQAVVNFRWPLKAWYMTWDQGCP